MFQKRNVSPLRCVAFGVNREEDVPTPSFGAIRDSDSDFLSSFLRSSFFSHSSNQMPTQQPQMQQPPSRTAKMMRTTDVSPPSSGASASDEEAIKALVAAKEREKDKKKRKALGMRETRARQALAAKALQRRVALLEIRVAELEEELRARAAA